MRKEYVRVVKWVRTLSLTLVAPVRIPIVGQSMIMVAHIQLTISNNCETGISLAYSLRLSFFKMIVVDFANQRLLDNLIDIDSLTRRSACLLSDCRLGRNLAITFHEYYRQQRIPRQTISPSPVGQPTPASLPRPLSRRPSTRSMHKGTPKAIRTVASARRNSSTTTAAEDDRQSTRVSMTTAEPKHTSRGPRGDHGPALRIPLEPKEGHTGGGLHAQPRRSSLARVKVRPTLRLTNVKHAGDSMSSGSSSDSEFRFDLQPNA